MPSRDVAMDGAVVYAMELQSEAVQWLHRRKLPMAYVDQPPDPATDCVNIDDRGGGRSAARHLLELGHRRIGILTNGLPHPFGLVDKADLRPRYYVNTERIGGWLDELTEAGVTPVVVHPDGRVYDAARLLFALPQRPTGLLCFSDSMAHEVYKAAYDAGLRVPDDVSIVGFDDARFAQHMRPALTTVRAGRQREGPGGSDWPCGRPWPAASTRSGHHPLSTRCSPPSWSCARAPDRSARADVTRAGRCLLARPANMRAANMHDQAANRGRPAAFGTPKAGSACLRAR